MLETIWFALWGLLWAVYFALDGFDLGMGTLLPFVARTENERRMLLNAAGPFWDGNEVWLIAAGGVTFAAFPTVYATMFSSLYGPLLIILFALIFRAVSFEFRSKRTCPKWRALWDRVHFLGSLVPALFFGVAFANLFMGIPLGQSGYEGNLLTLINPYGLAGGVLFVLMFCMHGALWLGLRTEGELGRRALDTARGLWPVLLAISLIFLAMTAWYTNLYANYLEHYALWIVPLIAVLALCGIRICVAGRYALQGWICSAVFILFVTFFGLVGMFPAILISSIGPEFTLGAFNASSSELTLSIMLGVVCVCIPLVIIYQAWVYSLFSHKITEKDLESDHAY